MLEKTPDPVTLEGNPNPLALAPDAIRSELERILHSAEFRGSKRCQDFLSFVVEQTLVGHSLKERTIGVAVFSREPTYDTNEDGSVRIKASEVRKRLTLYYAGTGKNSDLRIVVPVGTYSPVFSACPEPGKNLPVVQALIEPLELAPKNGRDRRWQWAGLTAILLLAIAVSATFWLRVHRTPSSFDQFWEPALRNPAPVLVVAAYTSVYLPSPLADDQHLRVGDFQELKDQYVGGGDLMAVSRITGMLSRSGHSYSARMGNVAFEDLRNSSSILIGYSGSQWQEVTKDLRFSIEDEMRGEILDFGKPTGWYPRLTSDRHTDEDYAIISRSLNPQTHSIVILVTGAEQYGTEAAANLITSPELLAEALRGAPKGWQQKNLQWVLRIKVIANSPATPIVIAAHYW